MACKPNACNITVNCGAVGSEANKGRICAARDSTAGFRLNSLGELRQAIFAGAVKRLRPKFMTAATMLLGLAPIMWSAGTGSDVMKRIAAPMIGGIFTSFLLELVVYPAVYEVWKWNFELRKTQVKPEAAEAPALG